MEYRDWLQSEEGIQDKDLLTVLRSPSALLRHSMHHAQFPELAEADSVLCITAHQLKARIVEDLDRYLRRGRFWNNISLRAFYAKISNYNRCRTLELRSRLAEV